MRGALRFKVFMMILGIESTCDETAASIVRDGRFVCSHTVASSADIHQRYGGVFPELASRRHIDAILPVIHEALQNAKIAPQDLDAIAVARGPGLIGSLLIGLNAAKGLAIAWNKPLIAVNHVEAHLYAAMIEKQPLNHDCPNPDHSEDRLNSKFDPNRGIFPSLGFVLSGGHTLMLKVLDIGRYELLSTTVDDAIGEAFDKSASILGLSYPGGPALEELARKGDEKKFRFSAGRVKKDPLSFSFSGLKTAVLYAQKKAAISEYPDIAASFQKTAFDDIANKAELALQAFPYRSIVLGGGVSNNRRLRALFSERFVKIPLYWPPFDLTMDNAVMIAALAYHKMIQGESASLDLEALPRLPFWNS